MKITLLTVAVVALVGCSSPQGINQTSNVKIGNPIWQFVIGNGSLSSPAIGSDGTVYVGSLDNKLYALIGKNGVKLWEFETGDNVESSPAIGSDGTVYVGSYDKKLYAIKTDSKGLAKSPWPMRGQNARHTGHQPSRPTPTLHWFPPTTRPAYARDETNIAGRSRGGGRSAF